MMPMTRIGQYIRRRREEIGISQQELGRLCGVTRAAVSQWEAGNNFPAYEKFTTITEALGAPSDVFEPQLEKYFRVSDPTANNSQLPLLTESEVSDFLSGTLVPRNTVSVDLSVSAQSYGYLVSEHEIGLVANYDIRPGDILIFDPEATPIAGDIVHAFVDSVPLVRAFAPRGTVDGRLVYDLLATDLSTETLTIGVSKKARILGVMIEHRRKRRLSPSK
jgi:transcriptional regulator with XRE-family HTH domain